MTIQYKVKKLLRIMTREELAVEMGVSVMSIDNWRNGRKTPIPYFQRRLAEVYREKYAKANHSTRPEDRTPLLARN